MSDHATNSELDKLWFLIEIWRWKSRSIPPYKKNNKKEQKKEKKIKWNKTKQ